MMNEVELMQIFIKVFKKLEIDVIIHINSRLILKGIVESFLLKVDADTDLESKKKQQTEIENKFIPILDKLDKIGKENVIKLMSEAELGNDFLINKLTEINDQFNGNELLDQLQGLLNTSHAAAFGHSQLKDILYYLNDDERKYIKIDPTLARGLDYYTGPIFEVKTPDFPGSIGSGGRYDNLTGNFGLPNVTGTGISFGLDRIYDAMEAANLFPEDLGYYTKVLFVNFDDASIDRKELLNFCKEMREANINTELYPSPSKLKKQMKYANDKQIPYVILAGEEELQSGKLTLKNMQSGEQSQLTLTEIIEQLKEH